MMEVKYSGIKLFGMKIASPENGKIPVVSGDDSAGESSGVFAHDSSSSEPNVSLVTTTRSCLEDRKKDRVGEAAEQEAEKDHLAEERSETKPQDKDPATITEESTNSKSSDDSPKTPSIGEETASLQSPNTENDQSDDATNSQKGTLKKPDKILPCPRCSSMETKFCYYNNYNINQPRHFCKSCQRYWTAGGAMRNVAVGAGRRKNKNWAPHCHHIAVSEGLRAAQIGAPNGTHCPTFNTNGAVLSLSSEGSRLCESMAFPSSLAEKKVPLNNGFYKVQQGISGSCRGKENSDDCSSGSSATTLDNSIVEVGKKKEIQEPTMQKNIHGFPSQVPFFSGVVPWSYPWNSAIPVPTICPSGIAIPSHPAPYWNCNFVGASNIPWLSPPSPAMTQKASDSSLGKHTRDGDLINPSIPKEQPPLEQKNFEISSLDSKNFEN